MIYKTQREKTYLRTCTSSEDSDQPAHSLSTWRILIGKDAKFHYADSKDTDQTARMHSLIWVLVVREYKKVRFLMVRLNRISVQGICTD